MVILYCLDKNIVGWRKVERVELIEICCISANTIIGGKRGMGGKLLFASLLLSPCGNATLLLCHPPRQVLFIKI